jgi:hypothetical protein
MSLLTTIRAPSPAVDQLLRLRAFSRIFATITKGAMVFVTLAVAGAWFVPVFTGVTLVPRLGPYRELFNNPSARIATLAAVLVLLAIFLFALDQVRRLFAEFAAGDILTARAAEKLQRISWALIAGAIFRPVAEAAIKSTFAPHVAAGLHGSSFALVFSLRDVLNSVAFLFAGFLLLAIAWALTEAARIADEYQQIV